MRSKPVALLLADLGVTKTHSRPHVSNDNPFSKAHVNTLKFCPQFPERFGSIADGRAFGQVFFPWYNHEHHHSALGFLTPAVVHFGQAATVRAQRQQVLACAHARPSRAVREGTASAGGSAHPVWISPPAKTTTAQAAPGTTIVTSDDLWVDPICEADDGSAAMRINSAAHPKQSSFDSRLDARLPCASRCSPPFVRPPRPLTLQQVLATKREWTRVVISVITSPVLLRPSRV